MKMDRKQWLEGLKRLTEFVNKLADEDVKTPEVEDNLRSLLKQLTSEDVVDRNDLERNKVRFNIRDRQGELNRPIEERESIALAMRLSSDSVLLSKRMLYVAVVAGIFMLCGVFAASWSAWENHKLNSLMSMEVEIKAQAATTCEPKNNDTPPRSETPEVKVQTPPKAASIVKSAPVEKSANSPSSNPIRKPSTDLGAATIEEKAPDQVNESSDKSDDAENVDDPDSKDQPSEPEPKP